MTSSASTRFPSISAWIAERPIAHRGLHDREAGIVENTLSAAARAADSGFAIEVDLHPSSDGVPMIFHDDTLDRLTSMQGEIRHHSAAELNRVVIKGTGDTIPTLRQLLAVVAGRVGLVLELKGDIGPGSDAYPHPVGFVAAVLAELEGYAGPAAIMSFDHRLVRDARRLTRSRPVGLTADGDDSTSPMHRQIATQADVDFVSYHIEDLPTRFVDEFRAGGRPAISWTIRTPELARKSALHVDQITFEGFDPAVLARNRQ